MNIVDKAEYELQKAGLFDKDSDYDGVIGKEVLDLIGRWAMQGNSGGKAMIKIAILEKLLRQEPLMPLTYEADEWIDQSHLSKKPLWQNMRDTKVFSTDGGKTHYSIDEDDEPFDWELMAAKLATKLQFCLGVDGSAIRLSPREKQSMRDLLKEFDLAQTLVEVRNE